MKTLWHLVHAPVSLFNPSTNASSTVASAVSWDADVGRTDMATPWSGLSLVS